MGWSAWILVISGQVKRPGAPEVSFLTFLMAIPLPPP
jgi:hypothetical protein